MPVTGQNETTTHINPMPRPVTVNNNHSTSTQFPATGDRAATTTYQTSASNTQPMMANQLLNGNNQALSCAPSLTAYQCIITSASVSYTLQSWLNHDVQF